jgi:ferritin-like metal-binding protein YciE
LVPLNFIAASEADFTGRTKFVAQSGDRSTESWRSFLTHEEPMARSMLGIRCIRSSQSLEFRELLVARKPKLLSDMFHDTLKDVYFAENKILKTLPKMAKAAQSKELKAAFVKHERETRGHVKRLEGVFKILGKPARAKTCVAILGITKEGAEVMTEYKGMPALDAGLLAAAQAVEHYEISRYGTLRTWAEELGLPDAVALLEATLKEEKATDAALTTLAKSVVNVEAEGEMLSAAA